MESAKTRMDNSIFPAEILSLPKVEVPVSGVTGYCMQNGEKQIVFFVMDEGVSFPDHSHCTQTGTILAGEMILEINGQTELFQEGDDYRVPEGVLHRTNFTKKTYLIDMSDAPDRYPVHE